MRRVTGQSDAYTDSEWQGTRCPGGASYRHDTDDDYTGMLRGSFTVLENPHHGPQLYNAVAESLPPQCGGPNSER
ncbi:MAG: hypothetical protein H0V49_02075 [Nocardioidaceae bacterium]|nr:hypothetical protein [Nocardioidaceae bacterium]